MVAARGNHEETMRALVAAGADPALRAQDGTGVLMAAVSGAKVSTVKYAYELDSDIDVVAAGSGNTLMHAAVGLAGRTQPEVVEVIQFLADRGAKLDEIERRRAHADFACRTAARRSGHRSIAQVAGGARRETQNRHETLISHMTLVRGMI